MATAIQLPLLLLASLLAVAAGQLPYAADDTSHRSASATHDHLRHHDHGYRHHSPSTTTATYPRRVEDTEPMGADPSLVAAPQDPSLPPSFTATHLASGEPQAEATSPPASVHAAVADLVSSGRNINLAKIAKVLASLGYSEMASAAELLVNSSSLVATWEGAITVFAAPDDFLEAACPGCSRCHLLLRHIALGYFRYANLAAAGTVKILAASGCCLDVDTDVGSSTVYVHGVEISLPELYDDGLYIVHGLRRFVPPLSRDSCVEATHHRRQNRSATTTSSVMRRAMAHLRDRGYGFVALAMRVKYAELDKLANLTVFALDDRAIFSGGRHGYVSAVRFHIVPGRRLTRADLQLLRHGTVLPTLAGEDHKLVITHGAGSHGEEVQINYIPLKEAELVMNPRIVVHRVYAPFPSIQVASSVVVASATQQMSSTCGVGGPFGNCPFTSRAAAMGNGDEDSSASEAATAPPADKPAAATTTQVRPHPHSAASAATHHKGRLHVTEKVGRAGVGAHFVGGGFGAAVAAAAAVVAMGVVSIATVAAAAVVATGVARIAMDLLKKERKNKLHRKRQTEMVRRRVKKLGQRKLDPDRCIDCQVNCITWVASCCGFGFCSMCVVNGYLDSHVHIYRRRGGLFCGKEGHLVPMVEPEFDHVHGDFFFTGEEKNDGHYMRVKTFVNLEQLQARRLPRRLLVWLKKSDNSILQAIERSPVKKNLHY